MFCPYEPGNKGAWSYSFGSWYIEVGVNVDTGEVKLVDLVGIYDCGRVVNRLACEAQIEGSFSMGLGQACYEEILLNDKGKVINDSYRVYRIPTFMDGPRNRISMWTSMRASPIPMAPAAQRASARSP